MALVFSQIEPNQVEGLWPYLQPGLSEVKTRWARSVSWEPEDIKTAISAKSAKVLFFYDQGNRAGYVIIRGFREEFKPEKYLHIWIAYLYPEYRGRVQEFLPEVWGKLEQIAQKSGANYIEMDSPRHGWGRLLKDVQMKKHRITYRKELGHG